MSQEDFEDSQGGIIKQFMYLNRRAPYGTIYAWESLEVVLIGAAFDQDVCLAFVDDGVFQIKKNQDTSMVEMKNFSRTYSALEDYDVTKIYVSKESLDARNLTEDDLVIDVEVKTDAELADLMLQQDVIFSF